MFHSIKAGLAILLVLSLVLACGGPSNDPVNGDPENGGTGTLSLYLTDAPIDADNVVGVYITINEIQYHFEGEWITFEEFEGPLEFNLLELTGGISVLLGDFDLPAGQYSQIRFMLDIPEQGPAPTNPGCYVLFDDETQEPLFVPSGGTSGYKATGSFQVPVNGTVEVTADFDVRKAVTVAGASGRYILKPTIRLVVNDEAGSIGGSITDFSGYTNIAVFAYEDGAWQDSEMDEPAGDENRFPNAVTSCVVDDEGEFILAFLAAGVYDLVVVEMSEGEFEQVLGFVSHVEVESKTETVLNIDISTLESAPA